jgi:hypothetical protein
MVFFQWESHGKNMETTDNGINGGLEPGKINENPCP